MVKKGLHQNGVHTRVALELLNKIIVPILLYGMGAVQLSPRNEDKIDFFLKTKFLELIGVPTSALIPMGWLYWDYNQSSCYDMIRADKIRLFWRSNNKASAVTKALLEHDPENTLNTSLLSISETWDCPNLSTRIKSIRNKTKLKAWLDNCRSRRLIQDVPQPIKKICSWSPSPNRGIQHTLSFLPNNLLMNISRARAELMYRGTQGFSGPCDKCMVLPPQQHSIEHTLLRCDSGDLGAKRAILLLCLFKEKALAAWQNKEDTERVQICLGKPYLRNIAYWQPMIKTTALLIKSSKFFPDLIPPPYQ
jgi:hypothetical protein